MFLEPPNPIFEYLESSPSTHNNSTKSCIDTGGAHCTRNSSQNKGLRPELRRKLAHCVVGHLAIAQDCQMLIALDGNEFLAAKKDAILITGCKKSRIWFTNWQGGAPRWNPINLNLLQFADKAEVCEGNVSMFKQLRPCVYCDRKVVSYKRYPAIQ